MWLRLGFVEDSDRCSIGPLLWHGWCWAKISQNFSNAEIPSFWRMVIYHHVNFDSVRFLKFVPLVSLYTPFMVVKRLFCTGNQVFGETGSGFSVRIIPPFLNDSTLPLCCKFPFQICGRMLSCRSHKCESLCHSGPCYPCSYTIDVFCACGNTKITVPCGRQVFLELRTALFVEVHGFVLAIS